MRIEETSGASKRTTSNKINEYSNELDLLLSLLPRSGDKKGDNHFHSIDNPNDLAVENSPRPLSTIRMLLEYNDMSTLNTTSFRGAQLLSKGIFESENKNIRIIKSDRGRQNGSRLMHSLRRICSQVERKKRSG